MQIWLWVLIVFLGITILLLSIKIYLLKKSAKEIERSFKEKLATDSNTLIDISSRDKYMLSLANSINIELRKLRDERHRYQNGDIELKNAITNVSHDLRTPLTAICGYLDLLDNEEKSKNVKRYIDIIKNRTELLKQLTEELFEYSTIIIPKTDNLKEIISINAVLEESIAAFYNDLNKKQIIPNISLPEDNVYSLLNKSSLSRIFSNLINNAIKYSQKDLDIILLKTGEITFSNTAPDLNKIETKKIFDRFYTAQNTKSSTGLGLTIAKTLTKQMGGEINAEYKNNKLYIYIKFPTVQ